ncbi:programmed cell death protein 6-like [Rhopilema esculentum]|uniref:programmed cell death protein 6-like n=1 Tax=Rhopilema esculentum TaxID=499914 RepID=UPI0031D4C698
MAQWNTRPNYGNAPQYNQGYGQEPAGYHQYQQQQPQQGTHPYQQPQGYQQQRGGYQPQGGGYPPQRSGYPSQGGGYLPQQNYPQGYGYQQNAPKPPPPGVDAVLWGWFQSVDRDGSGTISADELQQALLNNNWSHFNGETCRLMIGMFDKDRSGTIDVYEFAALWKYIQEWKGCFDRFDRDRSGTIDCGELHQAFTTFGYRLSMDFSRLCVRVFDRNSVNSMKFDDFIQCCVMLKSMTDAFKKYDTQQRGVIHINYEQFLEMVLDNTLAGI